jgi:hypothetical protein
MVAKIKTFKIVSPQGIASYEEMLNLDAVIQVALLAYADGERSPNLNAFVLWLAILGHTPTIEEFGAFLKSVGANLTPLIGTIENIEN